MFSELCGAGRVDSPTERIYHLRLYILDKGHMLTILEEKEPKQVCEEEPVLWEGCRCGVLLY